MPRNTTSRNNTSSRSRRTPSDDEGGIDLSIAAERTIGSFGGIRADASVEVGIDGILKNNRLNGSYDPIERTASFGAGLGSSKAKLGGEIGGEVTLKEDGSIESIGGNVSGSLAGFGGGISASTSGSGSISGEAFGGKIEVARDDKGNVSLSVCYGIGIFEACSTFSRDNGDPQNTGSLRPTISARPGSTHSSRPTPPNVPPKPQRKKPEPKPQPEKPKPNPRPTPEPRSKSITPKKPDLDSNPKKKPAADIRNKTPTNFRKSNPIDLGKKLPVDIRKKPSIDLKKKPSIDLKKKPSIDLKKKPSIDLKKKPPVDIRKKPSIDLKKKPLIDLKKKPPVDIRKKPSIDLKKKPSIDLKKKPISDSKLIDLKKPLTPPRSTKLPRLPPKPTPKPPALQRPTLTPKPTPTPKPKRPNPWPRDTSDPTPPPTPSPRLSPPYPQPDRPINPPLPTYPTGGTGFCKVAFSFVRKSYEWKGDRIGSPPYQFGDIVRDSSSIVSASYNENGILVGTVQITTSHLHLNLVEKNPGQYNYHNYNTGVVVIPADPYPNQVREYWREIEVRNIGGDAREVKGPADKIYAYLATLSSSSSGEFPNHPWDFFRFTRSTTIYISASTCITTPKFKPPRLPNTPQKIKPMDCCTEIKEIHKYLGIAKMKKKFKVAKAFLSPGGTGNQECEDYYAITEALFRMLANGLIINPIGKPLGNEWKSVNATAWAGDMYEMLAEAMSDGNSTQKYEISSIMQLVQILSIVAELSRKVDFMSESIGITPDLEEELIPACFTIYEGHQGFEKKPPKKIDVAKAKTDDDVEAVLAKMMKPSQIPIVKWVFRPDHISIIEALKGERT